MSQLPAASIRRRKAPVVLFAVLIIMAIAYLVLLPWRRKMLAETERLNRVAESSSAQANQIAELKNSLGQSRADVAHNPNDANGRLRLAGLLDQVGQLDEAAKQAQAAASLEPQRPEACMVLADIERRNKRYYAAVTAYKTALTRSQGNPQALLGLSSLYVSFGWPLDAEALLKPAVQNDPQNPHLKVGLALAYLQHENFTASEKLLQEVRRQAPDDVRIWSPLVHLYNEEHKYRDAIATAEEILRRAPGEQAVRVEQGIAYYRTNQCPSALRLFQDVAAAQPDDLAAAYYTGLCYERMNETQKAGNELEKVYKRSPGFLQVRLILGKLYIRLNRIEEGKRLLAESATAEKSSQQQARASLVLAGQPSSPDAHWKRALAYREIGDNPHMILEVQKTLELAPSHDGARKIARELRL